MNKTINILGILLISATAAHALTTGPDVVTPTQKSESTTGRYITELGNGTQSVSAIESDIIYEYVETEPAQGRTRVNALPPVCNCSIPNMGSKGARANIVFAHEDPADPLTPFRESVIECGAARMMSYFDSPVPLRISVTWRDMGGSASGGILASSQTGGYLRGFPEAPTPDIWYHWALANGIAGRAIIGGETTRDLILNFNTRVDRPGFFGDRGWGYNCDGTDGGLPNAFDLPTTMYHEMGHSMGFSSTVNRLTGKFITCPANPLEGCPDAYGQFLGVEEFIGGLRRINIFPDMPALDRAAAIISNKLSFLSDETDALCPNYTTGCDSPGGRASGIMPIYSPDPYRSGSSTAHYDTSLFPNEVMEPFATGMEHNLHGTVVLLNKVGWSLTQTGSPPPPPPPPPPGGECGDLNDDGRISIADALSLLQATVALPGPCVPFIDTLCDADGDGTLTLNDAIRVLKVVVGFPVTLDCPVDPILVNRARITSNEKLGGIMYRLEYPSNRSLSDCDYTVAGFDLSVEDHQPGFIGAIPAHTTVSAISVEGVQGPVTLAECNEVLGNQNELRAEDVTLFLLEAFDVNEGLLSPSVLFDASPK